jgi:hypothetical protein
VFERDTVVGCRLENTRKLGRARSLRLRTNGRRPAGQTGGRRHGASAYSLIHARSSPSGIASLLARYLVRVHYLGPLECHPSLFQHPLLSLLRISFTGHQSLFTLLRSSLTHHYHPWFALYLIDPSTQQGQPIRVPRHDSQEFRLNASLKPPQ